MSPDGDQDDDQMVESLSAGSTDPNEQWAHSSAVEHYLDMVGVTGSIPVAPTNFFKSIAYCFA